MEVSSVNILIEAWNCSIYGAQSRFVVTQNAVLGISFPTQGAQFQPKNVLFPIQGAQFWLKMSYL